MLYAHNKYKHYSLDLLPVNVHIELVRQERVTAGKERNFGKGDLTMTNTLTRTAIIPGASGGIGRAVALRLARDGFAIVVNYAGNTAKAEGVLNEIKSAGGHPPPPGGAVCDAPQMG